MNEARFVGRLLVILMIAALAGAAYAHIIVRVHP